MRVALFKKDISDMGVECKKRLSDRQPLLEEVV